MQMNSCQIQQFCKMICTNGNNFTFILSSLENPSHNSVLLDFQNIFVLADIVAFYIKIIGDKPRRN